MRQSWTSGVGRHLRATNDSYRVDETYIKIKKQWYYLYRAVDSTGATLDFMLSATRDADAAERFFRKVLAGHHIRSPRVSSPSTRTPRTHRPSRPSSRTAHSQRPVCSDNASI